MNVSLQNLVNLTWQHTLFMISGVFTAERIQRFYDTLWWIYVRAVMLREIAKIWFIEWLDICRIENSSNSSVKWLVYRHMGQRYRIPLRKRRGPTVCEYDKDVAEKFVGLHNEVLGPFGDYHGSRELLLEM